MDDAPDRRTARGDELRVFAPDLARIRDAHLDLGRELGRHLDDEEDLVIPLILERGERSLVGG